MRHGGMRVRKVIDRVTKSKKNKYRIITSNQSIVLKHDCEEQIFRSGGSTVYSMISGAGSCLVGRSGPDLIFIT
jgi:hypothetical protein